MNDQTPVATTQRRVTCAEIIAITCKVFEQDVAAVRSASRVKEYVAVRQAIALLAIARGHSSPAVGRHLDNRDHTSVLFARKQGIKRYAKDQEFRARVQRIRQQIDDAEGRPMPMRIVKAKPLITPQLGPVATAVSCVPPSSPDDLKDQIRSLRKRRWPVRLIAKRLEVPEAVVAKAVGVRWGGQEE